MYLPYVRGKQFELLAVKETAQYLGDHGNVRPVIEPVREKGSALTRCLDELSLWNVETTVIVNPQVGDFSIEPELAPAILDALANCVYHEHLRLGVIITANTPVEVLSRRITDSALTPRPIDFIHREFAGTTQDLSALAQPGTRHLVSDKSLTRRYRPELLGEPAKLTDPFPRRRTNLEYVDARPTIFTDDNLYFEADGFVGFSDYGTIGDVYTEGGSSPRAVVIHFTYPDQDNRIWIRHFCSDSNSDTADPAGKFGEAVSKLVQFCQAHHLDNPAIRAFASYHESEMYPGLGMVKKLSIQNHLYTVGDTIAHAS